MGFQPAQQSTSTPLKVERHFPMTHAHARAGSIQVTFIIVSLFVWASTSVFRCVCCATAGTMGFIAYCTATGIWVYWMCGRMMNVLYTVNTMCTILKLTLKHTQSWIRLQYSNQTTTTTTQICCRSTSEEKFLSLLAWASQQQGQDISLNKVFFYLVRDQQTALWNRHQCSFSPL